MAEKSPRIDTWMPIYIGDYLADTIGLTRAEHGAYLLSMMSYWRNGGPLTDEQMLGACAEHCSRICLFYQKRNGLWLHKRIEKELEKAKTTQESSSERARKAAQKRWNAQAMLKHSASNALSNAQAMLGDAPSPSPMIYSKGGNSEVTPEGVTVTPSNAPTEPHSSFPKTAAEASAMALSVGCPESFASSTWNLAMSRGGRDAKGNLIVRWPNYIASCWAMEQGRKAENKTFQQQPRKVRNNLNI